MREVVSFRSQVLEDKKVARATHNILAYRFTCPVTGVVHADCDDDGETAAASRLAEMLRLMSLTYSSPKNARQGEGEAHESSGGVAVIVSRWYGGVKLGPDRFKIINNSARRLIEDCGLFVLNGGDERGAKKKR